MKEAICGIRQSNPGAIIGISGDHTGDEDSLRFFYSLAIDYVPCAPEQIEQSRMLIAAADESSHVRVGHVRSGSSVLALLKQAWIGFHQETSKGEGCRLNHKSRNLEKNHCDPSLSG